MTKKRKILLSLLMLVVLATSLYFLVTTKVQRATHTTRAQAREIEAILEESNIVCKRIRWSSINYMLSNQGIFEYYDVFDDNGKEYTLTLAVYNDDVYKQVYSIYRSISEGPIYLNEDLYPERPFDPWGIGRYRVKEAANTTEEQAFEIVTILEEHGVICDKISLSQYMSLDERIEYYDITDYDGIKYILALSATDKQVYSIYNQTNDVILYLNKDLWPNNPPDPFPKKKEETDT